MAYHSPTSKTHSNLFEHLCDLESEDEGSPTSKPIRKARKKLREIEALERKPIKTMEEYKKIDQKEYYEAIVRPPEISLESYQDKTTTKQKKEFKRIEQKLKKKIAEHEEKFRKMKDTMERKDKDAIRKQRSLEEEITQLRRNSILDHKLSMTTSSSGIDFIIRNEYKQLCATKGSKKAWRDIMFKYHSDKTKKVLGSEVSDAIAKIATDLKPEY